MTHDEIRRHELSDFLRTRRARISPAGIGFPAAQRRRTPGLRREEVAQLAGMSATWYTWLEQRRPISVSPGMLENLARVLQLNPVERIQLFRLARREPVIDSTPPCQHQIESTSARRSKNTSVGKGRWVDGFASGRGSARGIAPSLLLRRANFVKRAES